ncbi:MAG: potassium-transporting ATPase subunit KdpC [Proteobacteria bacterium]|nr:potassium-transporting ATPase subunit KdpC [Pseudomonadota bacterium]
MLSHLRPALVLVAIFTILTGLAFPLAMTGIGGALFPFQAGGSLIEKDGKVIGSALIGQNFTSDRYFWSRPSAISGPDPNDASKTVATPYDASNSAASNLAPTSKALIDRVAGAVKTYREKAGEGAVPGDAVTTSASGLDPDISPENAQRQVARVAAARKLPEERLRALVAANTAQPFLGFIGQPRVNVLKLNLALDSLAAAPPNS